jgi:hypothetical protein
MFGMWNPYWYPKNVRVAKGWQKSGKRVAKGWQKSGKRVAKHDLMTQLAI